MSAYPGKSFVPRLPLERLRPLEERLSARLGPDPRTLDQAARAAGRSGPKTPNPWAGEGGESPRLPAGSNQNLGV